jgi:hypothetical protein
MAEQVSGQIGQEQVILNNAASETTLRLILEGIKASNSNAAAAIDKMAAKAGIDSKTIQAANAEVKKSTTSFKDLKEKTDAVGPAFDRLISATEKITKGNAQASEILETGFGKTTGVVGLFTTGMIKLAKFQEETLTSYRNLSQAGVNFGGSLTDLRMAASNSYMTLGDFSTLLKKHNDIMSRLGGTANDGATAFAKMSNQLLKSNAGDYLLALGMTADEVNNGMATYIELSGGRNKQEMQNTQKITSAAADYMEQLNGLAELTGKSRSAMAEELKEKAANVAWQSKLAGMDEEQKKKATEGLALALATGGKGAADAFQAEVMGVAPTTKAAREYTAIFGEASSGVRKSANMVKDSSKTRADMEDNFIKTRQAQIRDGDKLNDETTYALTTMNSTFSETITAGKSANNKARNQSDEDVKRALAKKRLDDSQAKAAAETQKAFQELGQSILSSLLPIVSKLAPVFNAIIQNTLGLKIVIVSLTAAFVAYKAIQLAQTGAEKLKQVRESGLSEAFKKTTLGQLGSKERPMYVIVVGGGAGAGGLEDLLDRKNKTRSNRLEKVKSGRLARGALKGIKGAGIFGALAGVAMLGGDLMSISDRLKNKEITEAEASTERGGAVGETGGGLAGGLAGAAAGAAIGSVIPVIGTAIGGIVGGMIGGFGGGALGKMIGEGIMGTSKEKPKMAKGGIATQATAVTVGEAGPEAIIPLTKFENLQAELATLNTSMHEVIKYMKDTAENTKRTHDATKALNGDWFAR